MLFKPFLINKVVEIQDSAAKGERTMCAKLVDLIETTLTHSKTTNFRLFQTGGVCRKFEFDKNGRKFSKWLKNTGEITCYEQFVLFPQCFKRNNQKLCYIQMLIYIKMWRTRLRIFFRMVGEYKPMACFGKG